MTTADRFMALDPGRDKYGWALFENGKMTSKGVGETAAFSAHSLDVPLVVLGNGTAKAFFQAALAERSVSVVLVEERGSTEEGKELFFQEEGGKGPLGWLQKLIGLAPRPVDDWAAVVLGRRYLSQNSN